jgi:hypothetical protein
VQSAVVSHVPSVVVVASAAELEAAVVVAEPVAVVAAVADVQVLVASSDILAAVSRTLVGSDLQAVAVAAVVVVVDSGLAVSGFGFEMRLQGEPAGLGVMGYPELVDQRSC